MAIAGGGASRRGALLRMAALVAGLAALAIFPVSRALAFGWPVANEILTATFGENRSNHFHDGIDIGGGGQAVHPAADGEVIYRFEEGKDPRDIPTGLGSFIVLQHPNGLRTLYAHFRKGTILETKDQVATQDTLGIVGDTGDSLGSHLHFSVIDPAKGEYLNPLTLLPPLPDEVAPVIASVSLERNRKAVRLESGASLPAGSVGLLVDVFDLSQYVDYYDPMAPYEIEAALNGKELFKITYDTLKATKGKLFLLPSDGRTFDNFYVSDWEVRLGSFTLSPGVAHLVVTARDVGGKATGRSFDINVMPPKVGESTSPPAAGAGGKSSG